MKQITITIDVDGNKITRQYTHALGDWGVRVEDMLETIKNSYKGNF